MKALTTETRHGSYLAMAGPVRVRPPTEEDAAAIHALIEKSPPLDTNSCYAYLLQAWHFAETCALAEIAGLPAAYVSAYIPPRQPDTLFIWQVVVAREFRRLGLARQLVQELLRRPACAGVQFITTTVTVGNMESEQLFRKLARSLRSELGISQCMSSTLFEPTRHPSERLFRIGPLTRQHSANDKEVRHEPEHF
jgi:L-2,4-diaminobutyric acid acetyltransferase